MPVYEYKCNACGREFEYQQRMSDPDKTVCEACGKEALERIISRTAFSLKGGGWYKDLYASPKPETAASEKQERRGGDAGGTGDTSGDAIGSARHGHGHAARAAVAVGGPAAGSGSGSGSST